MGQVEMNKEKAAGLTKKIAHLIKAFRYEDMPEELLESQ